MGIDRRTFLEQAALALFSVGISEVGISQLGKQDRFASTLKPYTETLAETTNRKLALLVGINQYSQTDRLNGCVNDVELQKELLIERFGFNPKDILTICDRDATRENIESAFVEHLRQQAKKDDIVVFHFSGYGSQTKTGNSVVGDEDLLQKSLVPVDGIIPTKNTTVANDILMETLIGLCQSLASDKLSIVLDTSFKNTQESLQGNFRIRSCKRNIGNPSPGELVFQEQLRMKLGAKGRINNFPGVILNATDKNQSALEGKWSNFNAGLFTYILTQYLWENMPSTKVQFVLQKAMENVAILSDRYQKPTISGETKPIPTYNNYSSTSLVGAEGFVSGIEKNGTVLLKLTGLSPQLINSYGTNSCFTTVRNENSSLEKIQLQIHSKEGVTAKAELINKLKPVQNFISPGELIQESIRFLSRNLGLAVALGNSLSRIERVDATSALHNVKVVDSIGIVGEQYADCLFGILKTRSIVENKTENSEDETQTKGMASSYGLFTSPGNLIPQTTGVANEAIRSAVNRLEPQLENILASKLLASTINYASSEIPLEATLEFFSSQGNNSKLLRKKSIRASITNNKNNNFENNALIPLVDKGSSIRLSLYNNSNSTLYATIVKVDNDGKLAISCPGKNSAKDRESNLTSPLKIAPKSKLSFPDSKDSWQWDVTGNSGIATIYLIASTSPFIKTLKLLEASEVTISNRRKLAHVRHPLKVARSVLEDLHQSSNVSSDIIGSNNDVYALDVNNWTTLNFVYEIA